MSASPPHSSRTLHMVLLLWVGTLWGVQPALIKFSISGGLAEIEALALVLLAVAATVGIYLAVRGRLLRPTRETLGFMAISSFLEYTGPLFVAFIVASHIDAGLLTLIMATTPVFTVALAAATRSDTLSRETLLACLVGLAAMALIVVPQNALPSRDMLPWCLLAFIVPVFYACGSTYVSRYWPAGLDPVQVTFASAAGAAISLSPFAVKLLASGNLAANPTDASLALVALIVSVALEITLYMYLLRHAGPVFTSFSSFVMIVSGFIAGAVLFGETPSVWIWASVALFSLSLILIIRSPRRADAAQF